MKITLTNFKCHKKKEIKIDKNSLILLDGKSGNGKSSIFEAIYFCLYGNGKRLINHNMKKMEVNIKFLDLQLQIIRSKGPNRLIVINKNGEFEDDIAQEIINETFGDQFLITSYITQDNDSSFLKLSSSEKMEFLEKQVFYSETNIDELKKLTKEEIKNKKLEVQKFTNSIELIQNELSELKEPEYMSFPLNGKLDEQETKIKLFNDKVKLLEYNIDNTNKELNKLNKKYDEVLLNEKEFKQYESDKQKYLTDINNIEKKLNNIKDSEILKNNNISIEKINEEISKLNITLEQLKTKQIYINKKTKYQDDLLYYKELYNKEIEDQRLKKEQYQKEYDELKNILNNKNINEIKKSKLDLENEKKLLNNEKDKITLYNQYINKLNKFNFRDKSDIKNINIILKEKHDRILLLKDNIQSINSRLSFVSCPHCSKSLILYKDSIKKAEGTTVSKEEKENLIKFKDEIKKLESEINEIEPLIQKISQLDINNNNNIDDINNKLKIIIDEINKFENNISEINTNTYKLSVLEKQINNKELSKTLIDMKNKLKEDKNLIDKLKDDMKEEINDNIDDIRNKIDSLYKLNNEYKTLIDQYNFFKNKLESINKNINNISNIISNKNNLENEINILRNKQDSLKFEQKDMDKLKRKLKKYEEYKKERDNFEKWQNKLEEAKNNEEEKSKELALINKYWNKILECESMAILSIIETINHNINIYLEKFFEENSINVSLSSFKETKKSIKHCINVNIFYKGETCDLNSLSGGERSRINLAFVLALNSLTNGKIILLDECIASLDSQLCDDILEILKEQNKLILVIAHQVNTGLFDQVIEI